MALVCGLTPSYCSYILDNFLDAGHSPLLCTRVAEKEARGLWSWFVEKVPRGLSCSDFVDLDTCIIIY